MLETVEIQNKQGLILSLPLRDKSSGFALKSIEGLGPVKAEITDSKFAQVDGAHFQSSRRDKRNIVMNIGFEPHPTVGSPRDLRNVLYQYALPKSEVVLRFFHTDGFAVETEGYIETLETPIFSKETGATISILCMDPDFLGLTRKTVINYVAPTGLAPIIEIDYEGTSPTGVAMTLSIGADISSIEFQMTTPFGEVHRLPFSAPMLNGDRLQIDTRPGHKSALRIRAGARSSLLYGVSPTANWFMIHPGGQSQLEAIYDGVTQPLSVSYYERYGGL